MTYGRGKGRRAPGSGMNAAETAYAAHLESERIAGRVHWYKFEALKFRLADKTFYTPDFAVMLADCTIELHEVKGFWITAARIKIKVCAELYPFTFRAFKALPKKLGGGWAEESFD